MSVRDRIRNNAKDIIIDSIDNGTNNVTENDNVTSIITRTRKKYVDRHTRVAIYLENEVSNKLDNICTEKGMKSELINQLLKDFFKKLIQPS